MKRIGFRILLSVFCLVLCTQTVLGAEFLVPGGQVIGLEIQNQTVTVVAFDEKEGSAGKDGGLKVGDRIIAINGKTVESAVDVRNVLGQSDGRAEISVLRGQEKKKLRIMPSITKEGPRLGVYLREGISGIGTVTWYDPESGRFAALGHSVSDGCGQPVAMEKGYVYPASVVTVRTGKAGNPGQLVGSLVSRSAMGTLTKNTPQGIFGKGISFSPEEKLPVATREQIHTGAAVIRSTVANQTVREYSVEILKVYENSGEDGRNMLLKITDPELLSLTGGIVQGMSGSPIIQDGKLVGAVTHVLVNDPTTGYGIFIENMLEAAG